MKIQGTSPKPAPSLWLMRLPGLLLLAPLFASGETPPAVRETVRKSLAGINREDELRSRYLFTSHQERKEYDSAGKLKSQSSYTWRRVWIDGYTFGRTLDRDGKPLTEAETKGEEEAIRKRLAELKAMTPEQIGKLREGSRQRDARDDAWLQEFPDALDYSPAGEETIAGRAALILDAAPRPGYRAKSLRARVFEKMRGRLWIDKADSQLARADAEMFDTVRIAFGVFGSIGKGTRFSLARKPVADGIWLTESRSFKFDVRLLLVKTIHREIAARFYDFTLRPDAVPLTSAQTSR